jgi:hypothetical protein
MIHFCDFISGIFLLHRENFFLFDRETAATKAASPALTCCACAAIAVGDFFSHKSSRLSASVHAFLNQPFSAEQHGSSGVHY